jgi:mRNA interferase RelE/StbE
MAYTVLLKRSAEKELEDLPARVHDRIVKALLSLQDDPFPRNARKLHGREGVRIRIGDYRVLYVVNEKEKKVEVISVADRKDVCR